MNVLVISLFGLVWMHVIILGDEMGPIEVTVISSGRCPPNANGKDLLKYESKLKRTSRSDLMLFMNLSFQLPLDDNLSLKLVLAKQTSQGWKDNYFQVNAPKACSAMRQVIPDNMEYLAKQVTIPAGSDACLPAGNNTIAVRLKHKVDQKVQFFYNKYRGRIILFQKEDVVFCNEAIVDVLPYHNG